MSSLWFPYAQMQTMPPPLKVVDAKGTKLRLESGQELIDSISSWWCAIHGYNHPEINSALAEQMQKFSHVMLGGLTHAPAEKLAKELVRITPQGLNHVFFADSGSVGMEVAMKMAVQFFKNNGIDGKTKFASLYKGYHGDTTGVMSIGDPEEGMHHLFKGFLPKQFFIHPSLQEMENLFKEHGNKIAAFACEPLLQGAGGLNFYPAEFLSGAKKLCTQYDILFIADEVATGFGRTGTMFACEQANITPDIMVLGKGLTAGYLGLSATLATDNVYNSFLSESYENAFMHGPTFMGNALACSAALASLRIFERENYLEKISRINKILKEELLGFEAAGVKETRVLGACGVIETLNESCHKGIQQFAAERGVWLRPFLNVVYAMPPYIISEEELRKICEVIKLFFSSVPAIKKIKAKSEIKRLVGLIQEIWPEVFIPIIGKEQVDYMLAHYQGEAVIASEIENGVRYFFIEDSNVPIGYFAYSLEEDCLAISKVYLKKSFRGLGLSSKIFSHFEKIAQKNNKGKLSLRVNRFNRQAVEVYLHRGFKIVKTVDQPFGDKFFLNDYQMEKITEKASLSL